MPRRVQYDQPAKFMPTTPLVIQSTDPAPSVVILREVIDSDLPVFFEQQLDPEAIRMAAFPPRDRQAFMAHWAKIRAQSTVMLRTILFEGRVAGNIVCFPQGGEREVGYWIGREYWGQGIASRALAEFLKQVTARPLLAHVAKHNLASRRVLEKCGFILFGESRVPDAAAGEGEEFILRLAGEAEHGPGQLPAAGSEADAGTA